nr:MAG TPA: hypothetical protein [Crassvirales sp.]
MYMGWDKNLFFIFVLVVCIKSGRVIRILDGSNIEIFYIL